MPLQARTLGDWPGLTARVQRSWPPTPVSPSVSPAGPPKAHAVSRARRAEHSLQAVNPSPGDGPGRDREGGRPAGTCSPLLGQHRPCPHAPWAAGHRERRAGAPHRVTRFSSAPATPAAQGPAERSAKPHLVALGQEASGRRASPLPVGWPVSVCRGGDGRRPDLDHGAPARPSHVLLPRLPCGCGRQQGPASLVPG